MKIQFLLGLGIPFATYLFIPEIQLRQSAPASIVGAVSPAPLPLPAPTPVPAPAPAPLLSGDTAVPSVLRMGDATGWKLAQDNLGMTAAHVIDAVGRSGTVKSDSGLSCSFNVVKMDPQLDLAMFKLDGECSSMPGLPVTSDIKEGEKITAIGFPSVFGGKLDVNEGTIKAIGTTSDSRQPDIETSDQVLYAGMSGGPCFTENGVFGVVSNGTNPRGQMNPGDRGWCAEIPEGWTKDLGDSGNDRGMPPMGGPEMGMEQGMPGPPGRPPMGRGDRPPDGMKMRR